MAVELFILEAGFTVDCFFVFCFFLQMFYSSLLFQIYSHGSYDKLSQAILSV